MKLENQVTSLEISKKLKELGVKQESLFWWYQTPENNGETTYQIHFGADLLEIRGGVKVGGNVASAFTVAELGEILIQCEIISRNRTLELGIFRDGDMANIYGVVKYDSHTDQSFQGATEADARGKMLIYLLENNLITTPKQ